MHEALHSTIKCACNHQYSCELDEEYIELAWRNVCKTMEHQWKLVELTTTQKATMREQVQVKWDVSMDIPAYFLLLHQTTHNKPHGVWAWWKTPYWIQPSNKSTKGMCSPMDTHRGEKVLIQWMSTGHLHRLLHWEIQQKREVRREKRMNMRHQGHQRL